MAGSFDEAVVYFDGTILARGGEQGLSFGLLFKVVPPHGVRLQYKGKKKPAQGGEG